MAGKRGARYRMRKVGFADLARNVAYVVEDTEAEFGGTVDVFSEGRFGPEARRLALERRDAMNRQPADLLWVDCSPTIGRQLKAAGYRVLAEKDSRWPDGLDAETGHRPR